MAEAAESDLALSLKTPLKTSDFLGVERIEKPLLCQGSNPPVIRLIDARELIR